MEFHYTWQGGRHFAPLLRPLRQGGFFEAPVYMTLMTALSVVLFLFVLRALRRRGAAAPEGRSRPLWYALYFYVCWLASVSLAVAFKTMIVEELDYAERQWFEPYLPAIHFYVTSACLAYLALVVRPAALPRDLPLAVYVQAALLAGYGLAAYRVAHEELEGAAGGALLFATFAACNYDLGRRLRRGPGRQRCFMRPRRDTLRRGAQSLAGLLASAAVLCALPAAPLAQGTAGAILGVVTDQNGAAVSGARIVARNVRTNSARAMLTGGDGRFRFEELRPGEYEVQAEREGFSREVRRGIVLTVGRDAVVNLGLRVGSVTERVVVTADAPPVNTTTSEISALVNERTITRLPLNGRDLFQLATLQIGVVNVGPLAEAPISSGTGAAKMSINGGRVSFNNFLLDGSSVNEAQNTTPGSVAGGFTGVDAVQEFQLLTNNYSAEFGGAGGGIINIVSKSGTNRVHGSAFSFLRNSALDARNFFDREEPPPFKRNQFGASLGAPLRKDRTFLFGAYEGLRQRLAQTRRFFVPTDAARLTAAPAVAPYVNLYPRPNAGDAGGGLGVFIRSESGRTDEDFVTLRGDHAFSSRDTFFARYTFDDSENVEPNRVISNSVLRARNQYTGLAATRIFSPGLVGHARFAYNRSRVFGDVVDVVEVPRSLVFVPGATALGAFLSPGGLSPLSDRTLVPRFLVVNNFEASGQLAHSRGAHAVKLGLSVRRIQFNAQSTSSAAGVFVFGSYEAFLRGTPQVFAAPLAGLDDAYRGIRTTLVAAYAQDDWRLRPGLTVNLGLRYEPMTSPAEADGKLANLRDIARDREPTVGAPFFKNNTLKNFGPRVGFAWDVRGDGATSVRGGYGIFFAHPFPYTYRHELSNQPPFFLLGIAFAPPFPDAFDRLANVPGVAAVQTYEFDPAPSYVQQWNLSAQRELFRGITATVAYVGSRGVHLPTSGNRNTSAAFTLLPGGVKQFPVGVRNPPRNPAFGPLRQTTHSGDSSYHAMQVNVERRLARGWQFQMAYTFSKSLDTSSDSTGAYVLEATQFAQDNYDLRGDRGPSVFDVRHNFTLNTLYELPFRPEPGAGGARRVLDFLFGSWELNGIVHARSGTPFNPVISFNNSNDGNTDNVERPSWAPGFTPASAVTGDPERYFNPAAFVVAPPGQYGNVGRNALVGPGLFTVDAALLKSARLGDRATLQLRAEAFNVFNRANFALPEVVTVFTRGGVVPPNVGRITKTSTTSRQLQFGLKLIF
ncbi:MAG TPA: carboxypeptidase regulatory-like domain-containing protein [Pyrinomonadaceae bacterium]|nr:carboxypeptidase regulatory-like domain-containing protein [Pyrinomonadaceae bacterium]